MIETDLRSELEARTAHLHLDRPVAAVVARGDRIRRRRRTAVLGGVAAVGAVGALAASALTPPGSSPLAPPAAYAAWGPAMVNLDRATAAEVATTCGADLDDFGFDVAAATAVAADSRGGDTVAVYRGERRFGVCALAGPAGELRPRSAVVGRLAPLRPGTHVALMTSTFAQDTLDAPVDDGVGALQVSPRVDRVEVEVAGDTFEAAVGNGVAMFWLPDGLAQADVDAARATAYDGAGEVLSATPLG